MPTIILKNVPDELYERLKRAAKEHGHNIDEEVLQRLEVGLKKEGRMPPDEWLRQLREIQKDIPPTPVDVDELERAIDEGRP